MKQVRFLDFLTALEPENNLRELEICLERSIGEDAFIREICAPLIVGGKRLRPLLFFLCSSWLSRASCGSPA